MLTRIVRVVGFLQERFCVLDLPLMLLSALNRIGRPNPTRKKRICSRWFR
jgi:hypothetical protein